MNCSFELCSERALKAIYFSLHFYYLEVLDQGEPLQVEAPGTTLSTKGSFVRIDQADWRDE